jgi:hypothetical protein
MGGSNNEELRLAHVNLHEVLSTPLHDDVSSGLKATRNQCGGISNCGHSKVVSVTPMGHVGAQGGKLLGEVRHVNVEEEGAQDRTLGYATGHADVAAGTTPNLASSMAAHKETADPSNEVRRHTLLMETQ